MTRIFYKNGDRIKVAEGLNNLRVIERDRLLWIDVMCATEDERRMLAQNYDIPLQSKQESVEIESSSRFVELDEILLANSNFLIVRNEQYVNEPVSFVLKDNLLISFRNAELRSFTETTKKIEQNWKAFGTGYHVAVAIFDARVDFDADMLEAIARDSTRIARTIGQEKKLDEKILLEITRYQEITMTLRENIVDKQRVISGMLRSELFPRECNERLRIMIKDINSLIDHTNFSFERLEYLQNTFLGLVNIEQNKIIKIFTVASVVFMPPTLIASLYGMNFKLMPELNWNFGYPLAIALMLLSSMGTLYFFRRKRWL
ncbi:MAG: magnesium transporter [Bacteroidetes bacterium]|nr:MAG: magnesium transporter [Bacteroidota bacterium]